MKKALKALVIVVAVIFVVVAAAFLGMDYAAKKGIELGATSALGVDTTVDSVSIRVLRSSVSIKGLQISNPEGYNTDRLMALDTGSVSCDVPSLLTKEARLREILLDAPELTVEVKPAIPPRSNIGELLDKLKSDAPTREEKEAQKHYRIDLIRVTDAKVRFCTPAAEPAEVMLPDIELRDVRNADGSPVVMADVLAQILARMGSSAFEEAKGVVPNEFRSAFGKTLGSARALIARAPQGVPKGGKSLEDIFGRKKKY